MSDNASPIELFSARHGIRVPVEEIGKNNGFTEFDKKGRPVKAFVPRDPSATGRAIRTHEAGHIMVKPVNVDRYGYNDAVSNVVENLRVDILHLPYHRRSERDLLAEGFRHRHAVRKHILPAIKACLGGEMPPLVASMLYQSAMTALISFVCNPIGLHRCTSVTRNRAWNLSGFQEAREDPELGALMQKVVHLGLQLRRMRAYEDRPRDLRSGDMRDIVHTVADLLSLPVPGDGKIGRDFADKPDVPYASALKSGRFEIVDLPKTVNCRDAHSRKRVPAMSGARISHKALIRHMVGGTTNRVFHRRIRTRKGNDTAILIDASGSMHITDEQLANVLRDIPSATIAYYAGIDNHRGKLYIYARDGKRFDSDHETLPVCGGGNTVDYESMLWMLGLPGIKHRIFVTDQGWTGGDPAKARELFEQATRDGRIVPCSNLTELQEHPLVKR